MTRPRCLFTPAPNTNKNQATGEGKTLVATLPAYLNGLAGKGAFIVTANDYLARRDAELMGQVHRFLGLSVGLIQQGMNYTERREAYGCDVTYVTNVELGFDYLRDNLALTNEETVLRERPLEKAYCLVDEADSILIDEARTPLIISKQIAAPQPKYGAAKKLVDFLKKARGTGAWLLGSIAYAHPFALCPSAP